METDTLAFAIQLARDAGAMIKEKMYSQSAGPHFTTKANSSADLVTATDQAVEQFIKSRLTATYPEHRFIGEETVAAAGGVGDLTHHPTWIVDPIDGTTNFIHGFPFVAVSIGLAVDKELILGVVFNPILDELYSAVKGQGAYLNESIRLPLHSTPLVDLSHCLVATEIGSDRTPSVLEKKMETIHRLVRKKQAAGDRSGEAHSIRATGSAALNMCCVAKGAVDVYWEVGCWEWDVAAAIVIVTEAGGIVVSGANDRNECVDVLGRKYLAIRPDAKDRQLQIAHEMWDLIPEIECLRTVHSQQQHQ